MRYEIIICDNWKNPNIFSPLPPPPPPRDIFPRNYYLKLHETRTFSRTFVVRNIRGMFLNNADSGNSC